MDCYGCPIIDICDIAASVKKASLYANIIVEGCRIKAQLAKADDIIRKDESRCERSEAVCQAPEPVKPIPNPYTKTYKNFREESNKLREQKKHDSDSAADLHAVPTITVETEEVRTPIALTTCPTCGGRTTMDDIKACCKCGKIVCSNCSTENGGLMEDTPKIYCNECWEKR